MNHELRDPELRGESIDAVQLPSGEPDPNRTIERLKVATRESAQELVRRKVGVPVGGDISGIRTSGEDKSQRLSHGVVEIVRPDGESAQREREGCHEARSGSGRSPPIRTLSAKQAELLNGSLDRENRRGSMSLRTTSTGGATP